MGLDIKRNKEGLYSMKSTVSDESYHPDDEWITENEMKKILIHKALHKFIESAIEIDMAFPNYYHVNGKYHRDDTKPCFNTWMIKALKSDDLDDILEKKFTEVYNKLELEFKIP